MNIASAVPSGVLISTAFSATGIVCAEVFVAVARPAATDNATKSRRDRSRVDSSSRVWSSSVVCHKGLLRGVDLAGSSLRRSFAVRVNAEPMTAKDESASDVDAAIDGLYQAPHFPVREVNETFAKIDLR